MSVTRSITANARFTDSLKQDIADAIELADYFRPRYDADPYAYAHTDRWAATFTAAFDAIREERLKAQRPR